MLDHTPKDHADHEPVKELLEAVRKNVDQIQDHQKKAERKQALTVLQEKIENSKVRRNYFEN